MKHPRIMPGRRGLPPTSNVPWNAANEADARRGITLDARCMLSALVSGVLLEWICWGSGIGFRLWNAALWATCFALCAYCWARKHAHLAAMMLNKPHAGNRLTLWTEHPWHGCGVAQRQGICMGVERYCGRVIDFTTATYFPATERFAKICDCGRGHFQIPPKAERAEFKRQNTIAQRLASEGICDEQEHYT